MRDDYPRKHTWSRGVVEETLRWIGWLLIGTGVVCNEWVLTILLSPDGVVEIQNRVAIWLFDIVLLSLGLCLVKLGQLVPSRDVLRRLSQSSPRTLALSIGLLLVVITVVCTEGIFYG